MSGLPIKETGTGSFTAEFFPQDERTRPRSSWRPEGDHYRTRLTHTLEVAQIARTIAKALRLNESLTEAIALGHDLGHTPFGHAGECDFKQDLRATASPITSRASGWWRCWKRRARD